MKLRFIAVTVASLMLWAMLTTAMASDKTSGVTQTSGTAATEQGTQKPNAVLPELNFEFEPVVDGTQVTHDYHIKNTGDGPLAIHRVKTG